MSVFIVQVYEDVLGAFSTREKADAYIATQVDEYLRRYARIEVMVVE
jgi:hypothetical protein